jgi:galactokinase
MTTFSSNPFKSRAPGRLCLFGEHQDYLSLPVIALAIPLECCIEVVPHADKILRLSTPQLPNENRSFDLENLPEKQRADADNPDFALAALHDALDDGWVFLHGADCTSTTTIPLKSGCSSSTAFTIAWVQVLAKLSNKQNEIDSPLKLAQRAHRAEVLHFGAPGGTMDHITIAFGSNFLRIGPGMWDVQFLGVLDPVRDGVWVLADSGEVKDTMKHLKRCKGERLKLLDKLGGSWEIDNDKSKSLNDEEVLLLKSTITTRDREEDAAKLWTSAASSVSKGSQLGRWMLEHHEALRDGLLLSTPKIEILRQVAMNAGAFGFKIVGSGGGGCCVAWSPLQNAKEVSGAMRAAGAKATWIIESPSKGASIETIET